MTGPVATATVERHATVSAAALPALTAARMAEMIGTTRETLAHTLSDFRRRGLLDTSRHQVTIRDAERLADVADGD